MDQKSIGLLRVYVPDLLQNATDHIEHVKANGNPTAEERAQLEQAHSLIQSATDILEKLG